ncbi:MAG: ACP S-malonyltransferase [Bacteroidales bacterium]|jgi:[acyl-carrier-protein] S-malonyltransferase|nr:ACP S-malonyltransferase [Bacteroidales bacterium]
MKAFIFPGQGAQFSGMGKDLYDSSSQARDLFNKANHILDFKISDIMFEGTEEELKQTKVTQPAIFLHSVILSIVKKDMFKPDMVAGHSLGEFSALTAIGALSFEDGLKLVTRRAMLMQEACEKQPSTMAAVMKLETEKIESLLKTIVDDIVVPANYNSPAQLVISGTISGVEKATVIINEAGGKVIPLKVGGAFHSPLMEPAREGLAEAINKVNIKQPECPIYQNVNALPVKNPDVIKTNLINQLTSPVKWMQIVQNMIANGATQFYEVGPGTVLQGLVKKVKADAETYSL